MQWFFQFRLMLPCTDNCNAHWIMNRVGKWCGSVVSKNACWNHITRHPSKIKGNSLFMVSKGGCNFKNIWRGRSRAAVSLKAMQQRSMFVWKASHCSAAVYSYILYASGLVSWHKFSLANIFLHSDQPSTTALAFHLYYHLPHPRLGTILYKQDKIALTDWSVQSMWDWRILSGQTSEHTVCQPGWRQQIKPVKLTVTTMLQP